MHCAASQSVDTQGDEGGEGKQREAAGLTLQRVGGGGGGEEDGGRPGRRTEQKALKGMKLLVELVQRSGPSGSLFRCCVRQLLHQLVLVGLTGLAGVVGVVAVVVFWDNDPSEQK